MNLKRIIIVFLSFSIFMTGARASQEFKYNFIENDTFVYTVKISNRFDFPGLGNLTALLNLEGMSQHINIIIEVSVENINPDTSANIKAVFRKIVMTTVMGNRVFTDDGSSWGALKPGSEYRIVIAPDGRVMDLSGTDSVATEQETQMVQGFFPVFPKRGIEKGYRWTDSLNIKINPGRGKSAVILSRIAYSYIGIDVNIGDSVDINEASHRFDFNTNGVSDDTSYLQLSGEGYFYFDNTAGRIIEAYGDYTINAIADLAAFGVPDGFGNGVPVNIKSEIRIRLKDER